MRSAVEGTVTVAAREGATVTRGQALYERDDKPVTLLYGPVPAFREMRAGCRGSDVLQLERNLLALGYGAGLYVDPRFDRATEAAVKRWQKSLNRTPTGRVGKGDVVFQPDQVKVASADAALADQVGPADPVLTVASTRPVVRAELDQGDVSLTAKGTRAEVELPSGRREPGRVTGTAAPEASGEAEDGGPGDTVTVEVALDGGRSVAAGEDSRATASVTFVSEPRGRPRGPGGGGGGPARRTRRLRPPGRTRRHLPHGAGQDRHDGRRQDRGQRLGDHGGHEGGGGDPMTPEPALSPSVVVELRDVTKSYAGGVHALRGVSLTVRAGELLAIVGPSGSGKSTMLNVIGTLDKPTSGTVRVAGHDVGALSDARLSALRARHIGFVFQHFHLAAGRDAVDNVADGLLYAGVGPKARRARAREALERVRLGHRLGHRPSELSGGEKQRVAIARALVGEPSVLLADEPTGALDTASGEIVMDLLHELNGTGTTICVITHDHDIAASLPRRVRFRDGEIIADSGPRCRTAGEAG